MMLILGAVTQAEQVRVDRYRRAGHRLVQEAAGTTSDVLLRSVQSIRQPGFSGQA